MSQRMGRSAEDAFKQACSRAGITCNKSIEDDHGWDFIVEIPMRARVGTPDDKLSPVRSALVQVKSTQAARPRLATKVSNALQYAKRSEPCLLVLYHKLRGGESIYARLFGERDTKRALRRGRELFVAGRRTNKARITFGFSACEDHTSDLVEWLITSIQTLPEDYVSEKRKFAAKVGYGDTNLRANVTFVTSRGVDDLVDLELGIKDQLEVSQFTVYDKRFGIEAPDPIHHHEEPGIFRMEPSRQRECMVTLETKDDAISIPSQSRISVVRGTAPEKVKIAFVNHLFHIVIGKDGTRFTMRNVASKKLPIADLSKLATMFSWSDERVQIRVTGEELPKTNVQTATVPPNANAWDPRLAAAIRLLGDLALRGQARDLTLSIEDVLSAHLPLMSYFNFFTAHQLGCQVSGLDGSVNYETLKNLLGYVDVTVGEYTILTLFDCAIETRVDENGNLLVDWGPRNVRDCIVGSDREEVRDKGQAIFEQCGGGYGDDWWALGSVNEMVESSSSAGGLTHTPT